MSSLLLVRRGRWLRMVVKRDLKTGLLIIMILCFLLVCLFCSIRKDFIVTPTSHKNIEYLAAGTSKKLTNDYSVCFAIADHDPIYGDYIQLCISGPDADNIWNEQRMNSKLLVDGVSVPYTTFKKSFFGRTYHLFLVNCASDFEMVSFTIDEKTACFYQKET